MISLRAPQFAEEPEALDPFSSDASTCVGTTCVSRKAPRAAAVNKSYDGCSSNAEYFLMASVARLSLSSESPLKAALLTSAPAPGPDNAPLRVPDDLE